MNNPLMPVFVYGTLRSGLGNYLGILDGNTVREVPATLRDATMFDAGGCPFVSLIGTGTVHGEVMYLDPDTAEATMTRLDRLEGYSGEGQRNMYDRVVVDVEQTDGTVVSAYTYVTGGGFADWTTGMPVIASGDWKSRKMASAGW